MMYRLLPICLGLFVAACQSNAPALFKDNSFAESRQWQASSLSDVAIAKANAAVKSYEKCLNDEALSRVHQRLDPRATGDQVLGVCETRLLGIKLAHVSEGVPDVITERYIRKTRSQGAQSLMRFLQMVHAQRTSETEDTSAATKK